MDHHCIKATVNGRVQGVGYRHAVSKRAREANVAGHVSNLADGSVEVIACGEQEKIDRLIEWLWHGPPAAQVTHVQIEEIAWCEYTNFTTG
ncbi:acylphosphatase [Halomonas sp. GXIMD04776]|uniref:acylphosphatase n=1 Tax=Halomonas sp. GXIMD04776 TaxID=3415605 RepID=UPI003C9F8981